MKPFGQFVAEEPNFARRRANTHRSHQPFQTDEMGRPDPNPRIQRESVDYCFLNGLPRPNHSVYVDVDQLRAGRIADAYDNLPLDDSNNPAVIKSYEALAYETEQQWDFAVDHGMVFEPWVRKDAEAYGSDSDVFKPDADIFHRHLYFFTGGEPNRFMARISKKTGYSINDMFRAVHDYYGHACVGSDFGPVGEENAWVSHMQMFTPHAQAALTTETRGQNSWVNFGRQNYDAAGRYLYKDPTDRPFAIQKTAIFQGDDAWIAKLPTAVTDASLKSFNEDVQMAVASANLKSFRYDETTNVLTVRFRSGGVYRYEDVPADVVDEMRFAESRGRYFHRYIRNSYTYTQLEAPRPGFSHAKNTAKSSVHLRHTLKVPHFTHKLPRLS